MRYRRFVHVCSYATHAIMHLRNYAPTYDVHPRTMCSLARFARVKIVGSLVSNVPREVVELQILDRVVT